MNLARTVWTNSSLKMKSDDPVVMNSANCGLKMFLSHFRCNPWFFNTYPLPSMNMSLPNIYQTDYNLLVYSAKMRNLLFFFCLHSYEISVRFRTDLCNCQGSWKQLNPAGATGVFSRWGIGGIPQKLRIPPKS